MLIYITARTMVARTASNTASDIACRSSSAYTTQIDR